MYKKLTLYAFFLHLSLYPITQPLTVIDTIAGIKAPGGIATSGNYAYVCSPETYTIGVVDISSPASPTLATNITVFPSLASEPFRPNYIAIKENYAYLTGLATTTDATITNFLNVVDISNPLDTSLVASPFVNEPDSLAWGSLALTPTYAYVCVLAPVPGPGFSFIAACNILNPTNPILTSTFGAFYIPTSIAITPNGEYAYVTDSGRTQGSILGGLYACDIGANPTDPDVTQIPGITYPQQVAITPDGSYAYVTEPSTGTVYALGIGTNPTNPAVTSISGISSPYGITITPDGAYACVSNVSLSRGTKNQVQLLNIGSNPTTPPFVNPPVEGFFFPETLTTITGYAYVCNNTGFSLGVIDTTTTSPAFNTRVDTLEPFGFSAPYNIAISANSDFAYVTNQTDNSISSINITNPFFSTVSETLKGFLTPQGVAVQGDYAYVCNNSAGSNSISVLDITTATSPLLVANSLLAGLNPKNLLVNGNYAFVAGNSSSIGTLGVIDISTPTNPTFVTSIFTGGTNSSAYGIVQNGSYLYMLNTAELAVIDITAPTNPTLVTTVATSGNGPIDIVLNGDYAYVVNNSSNSLDVFDITAPASPSLVATVATSGSRPYGIAVYDDILTGSTYAYVTNQSSSSVDVFNITTPTSPTYIDTVSTGAVTSPSAITVSGTTAYVTNYGSITGLVAIFDLSTTPTSPVLQTPVSSGGTSSPATAPSMIATDGTYAFVTNSTSNNMGILNITSPLTPTLATAYTTFNTPYGVATAGNYAYVVNNSTSTMSIVDASEPAQMSLISSVGTSPSPLGIALNGNYAYIISFSIVDVFDISTPTSPVLVGTANSGSYNNQGQGFGIALGTIANNEYAFVTNPTYGETPYSTLGVINISSPTNPQFITSVNTSTFGYSTLGIAVGGNYAYLCNSVNGPGGLVVFDVSTPNNPTFVTHVPTSGDRPEFIALNNNYAYVTDTGEGTVDVIDISNPTNPQLVDVLPVSNSLFGIAISPNGVAYVAASATNSVIALSTVAVNEPQNFAGCVQKKLYPTQALLYNQLSWQPPVGGNAPVMYYIYRDAALTQLVASLPATQLTYSELATNGSTYYIIAVDAQGIASYASNLVVTQLCGNICIS